MICSALYLFTQYFAQIYEYFPTRRTHRENCVQSHSYGIHELDLEVREVGARASRVVLAPAEPAGQ